MELREEMNEYELLYFIMIPFHPHQIQSNNDHLPHTLSLSMLLLRCPLALSNSSEFLSLSPISLHFFPLAIHE